MNYYTFQPHWPVEKVRAAIAAAKAPKPLVEETEFCDWLAPFDREMDPEEQGMIQFEVVFKDEEEIIAKAKAIGYTVKHQYAFYDGSYYLWVAAEDREKCQEELTAALGQPVLLKLDDPDMKPYKGDHKTLKSYMDAVEK